MGGRVLINGTDIAELNDRDLTLFRRRNIGLVFQSFNLIPTLTAEENSRCRSCWKERTVQKARQKSNELLNSLGLAEPRGHRPDAMSGGEQQRVAIGQGAGDRSGGHSRR